MSAEVASAFVTLVPSFRGGPGAITRELGGPITAASRTAGHSAGLAAGRKMSAGMGSVVAGAATRIFAPLAAAAAAVSIGAFLKDSVSAASDVQEAGTKTEAIFGKQGAASIQAWAKTAKDSIGQSRLAALDSAATFGVFGKAAGKTGKPLAEFSTGLSNLSSDLASFYNTSPEEAAQAIASGLRGEAEPLRKYGVLLDDATLRQKALKMGLVKTTKEALTPQQKVLAAQAVIYDQTKDAQGDFAKTSGGLANQQRTLAARFEDLKVKVGDKLLPVVNQFVGFISDKAVPAISGLFDLFVNGDYTAELGKALGVEEDSNLVAFLFRVRDGFIWLKDKAVEFWEWAQADLWPALQEAYQTILPGVQDALKVLSGVFDDTGGSVGDLGGFLTDTLIPAIAIFVRYWLPVMAVQWRIIIEAIKAVIKVATWLGDKIRDVVVWFIEGLAKITRGFAGMLRTLSVVPGFGWAKDAADKMDGAASKAETLARKVANIERNVKVNVDIYAKTHNLGGRITLPDGSKVNVGMRAKGGPVRAGQPYVVGEKRPELFVPKTDGYIAPSVPSAVGGGAGLGSDGTATLHLYDADGVLLGTMRAAAKAEVTSAARGIARGTR